MAKIAYQTFRFKPESLDIITVAEEICEQYAADGYDLTLRQLYYQFVARDYLPNTQQSYKRLGGIVNDARLAGLIDWDHLVDRTRNLASLATWSSPASIVSACAAQYREDKWRDQAEYVEVWVEKEALAGVVARAANAWQVPYFSCRGYVSQSEMHGAAQRIREHERGGQKVTVIHLGDHDPSGLDMTRDIRDRIAMFGSLATIKRIALNMDQVEQYSPPPNPAKVTDARFTDYQAEYGDDSWELDALDPATLDALIRDEIETHVDQDIWDEAEADERTGKRQLRAVSNRWTDVTEFVDDGEG
jgi:hypothetical protein